MRLLRFLGRYFGRYVLWLIFAGAAAALYAVLTGAMVGLIEPVFREVLQADPATASLPVPGLAEGESGDDASSRQGRLKILMNEGYEGLKDRLNIGPERVVFFVPLLLVTIFMIRALASFVSGYSFQHIGLGVTNDIRNDLYQTILGQSSRFHSRHSSGELISRIVNDVAMIENSVSTRMVALVQQSMTLVMLLLLLFSQDRRLATFSVFILPFFVIPIVRFGQGMRRTSHKSQERMADLANLVGEGVRGHRVVKAFGMEEFEYKRFRKATKRHLRVNLVATLLSNLSGPVIETVGVVAGAGLLVYAGLEIRQGAMSAPGFIAFLSNLFWMYEPLRKLNKVNLSIQQSWAALRRVSGLMDLPNEIQNKPNAARIHSVERDISFDKVSFAYDGQVVLHDVDLRLRKGKVVALVGPSGAGKSTVVNLVPRFFDPDSGCVRIDGIDIRDLELSSLRALIGLVTQDTILFDDSIHNNISYGHVELPFERIREAAAAAYADEFISQLPNGYDTVIGESGLNLSGGQRQRLAIARAILKDAPILILDEATSQLDTESESLVQKALNNLMQGRTTLVIAHRLSTVQKADQIIVMDAGRVVEQGTHQDLVAHAGLYKKLYDLQFQD